MKKQLLGLGLLVSTFFANADVIRVERQAALVRVNSATVTAEGRGFPSYRVTVNATFGNSCEVPRESELVKIADHKKGFEVLSLTLAQTNDRACPAVYMPVDVTIDLGTYTKPNDGAFQAIYVNGKKAVAIKAD